MSINRFYHPDYRASLEAIPLSESESHHARHVLRLENEDVVAVFNGMGSEGTGHLKYVGKRTCIVEFESHRTIAEPQTRLVLAVAIPEQRDTLSEIIRESVQLGVTRFHLLKTRYCGWKRAGNPDKLLTRCERIIINSAKQCGQLWMPSIKMPVNFADFFKSLTDDVSVFCGMEPSVTGSMDFCDIQPVSTETVIWIVGPEGGWSADELQLIRKTNMSTVRMGHLILTTKVAAVAGLSALISKLDRW